MAETATGRFVDGRRAAVRAVSLAIDEAARRLVMRDAGDELAAWPLDEVRLVDVIGGTHVYRRHDDAVPARLETTDTTIVARLAGAAPRLNAGDFEPRAIARVVGWSLAAIVGVIVAVVVVMPMLARQIAAIVAVEAEIALGDMVEPHVRALFPGAECRGEAGVEALRALGHKLADAAGSRVPPRVTVIRNPTKNALALPGGRVYLLSGLIDAATGPDALAGILAHEIGHVVGRHGTAKLIHDGGTSFLLGLLLGDFTGAGAIVFVGQQAVTAGFSREAETEADEIAIAAMRRLGRGTAATGDMLATITGGDDQAGIPGLFRTHPITGERVRRLREQDTAPGAPLLDAAAWDALKRICAS